MLANEIEFVACIDPEASVAFRLHPCHNPCVELIKVFLRLLGVGSALGVSGEDLAVALLGLLVERLYFVEPFGADALSPGYLLLRPGEGGKIVVGSLLRFVALAANVVLIPFDFVLTLIGRTENLNLNLVTSAAFNIDLHFKYSFLFGALFCPFPFDTYIIPRNACIVNSFFEKNRIIFMLIARVACACAMRTTKALTFRSGLCAAVIPRCRPVRADRRGLSAATGSPRERMRMQRRAS